LLLEKNIFLSWKSLICFKERLQETHWDKMIEPRFNGTQLNYFQTIIKSFLYKIKEKNKLINRNIKETLRNDDLNEALAIRIFITDKTWDFKNWFFV